jgi:hypothetical protein
MGILSGAMLWPCIPAVTAMAIVTLGATIVTLVRIRGSTGILPIMLIHLAVYGSLYALFVGESLHAAAMGPGSSNQIIAMMDLIVSICPMAITLDRMRCELRSANPPGNGFS